MSDGPHRRRVPVPAGRRSNQSRHHHHPSPSPSPSRQSSLLPRRSPSQRPGPARVLKRCSSEPLLWDDHGAGGSPATRDPNRSALGLDEGVLFRPRTCSDVFASSPSLMLPACSSPLSSEGYSKDAKVVVSVTVEGSPGPIKALVRLGSTVDQTINQVLHKYGQEGRAPELDATHYELHHSYFSLQCLDRSELIGDVGSRSFYLRRGRSFLGSSNGPDASFVCEPLPAGRTIVAEVVPSRIFLIPFSRFFAGKLGKIVRRTRKLWRVLACI